MTISRPPDIDERDVADVIARVRDRLRLPGAVAEARPGIPTGLAAPGAPVVPDTALGIHPTVESAVAAAREAFRAYGSIGLDRRYCIVEAIRRAALAEADRLAHLALEETGMGRLDDKATKIRIVAEKAPGPEDLEPRVTTGDRGTRSTSASSAFLRIVSSWPPRLSAMTSPDLLEWLRYPQYLCSMKSSAMW